jgi:hypothetical protein
LEFQVLSLEKEQAIDQATASKRMRSLFHCLRRTAENGFSAKRSTTAYLEEKPMWKWGCWRKFFAKAKIIDSMIL